MSCSLLSNLVCEPLGLSCIDSDFSLELWFFLNHELNGVLNFGQQVAIVLSVFGEFFVFGDDFLEKGDLFLFRYFLDVLDLNSIFLVDFRFFSFKSHLHLCLSRYFFLSFLQLGIQVHLLLLSFSF